MARASLGRGLHKYPPIPTNPPADSPIDFGSFTAKIYGNNNGVTVENPTTDTTPQIEGYLPPGWILNTATVSLSDGTTSYGPFAISVLGSVISIAVNSSLPLETYHVLGTPVTNSNGVLTAILRSITIQA